MNSHRCPACGYALGGEVKDIDLGKKRETEEMPEVRDPEYQLPVYRGEKAAEESKQPDFATALRRRRVRRGSP